MSLTPFARVLLAAALVSAASHAAAQDTSQPAVQASAEVAVSAAPAATDLASLATLPQQISASALFDGRVLGSFGGPATEMLKKSPRVAVGGFRVLFTNYSKVKAQKRGGYFLGRESTGARSISEVTLEGVSHAQMQAITDAAYKVFIEQLKLAGREVVTLEAQPGVLAALDPTSTSTEKPYEKDVDWGFLAFKAKGFSPTGVPLWFTGAEQLYGDKSPFSQGNTRQMAALAKAADAVVVAPLIVVDFAKLYSSGNAGMFSTQRDASTSTQLLMNVSYFHTAVDLPGKVGALGLKEGEFVPVDTVYGTLETVAESDNSSLIGGLMGIAKAAKIGGTPGQVASRQTNAITTDDARFGAAAQAALALSTGAFAKLFAEHQP